jgi:hypothetical protein
VAQLGFGQVPGRKLRDSQQCDGGTECGFSRDRCRRLRRSPATCEFVRRGPEHAVHNPRGRHSSSP